MEKLKMYSPDFTDGRLHSDWLFMMYSRLKLAKELLKDDGVIFISIDDGEQANLKRMCDEIFGEDNFLGSIIRKQNGKISICPVQNQAGRFHLRSNTPDSGAERNGYHRAAEPY